MPSNPDDDPPSNPMMVGKKSEMWNKQSLVVFGLMCPWKSGEYRKEGTRRPPSKYVVFDPLKGQLEAPPSSPVAAPPLSDMKMKTVLSHMFLSSNEALMVATKSSVAVTIPEAFLRFVDKPFPLY